MCGIAGFFGIPDWSVPTRVLLQRMISAMSHRGPDEQGIFVDDGVGLGHARLSIIDLATGRQPMANADRTVFLSFNGEIFNYVELREGIASRLTLIPRSSCISMRRWAPIASSDLTAILLSHCGTAGAIV